MAGTYSEGYIGYSNMFLNDTSHSVQFNDYILLNDKNVHVLVFNRDELARIENDMNNYAYIEIPGEGCIYSIYIKSTEAIETFADYSYFIESFSTFEPTADGYIRTAHRQPVKDRGWNKETEEFYYTYFADYADFTWGIFEPDTAIFSYNQLEYYEKYLDYEFPVILNYSEFCGGKHKNLKQRLDMAWSYGKVLELTLQTTAVENGNMIYDILNGKYDEFLYDYAEVIADFEHPVLFRLFNEMNGDWCIYSAYHTAKDTLIFKEVYRYVYEVFEEQGANENTIWVWNPNEGSFPGFDWNHTLMYYPGDEYVDIVGLTAYNTGTYYAAVGETWKEFDQLYDDLYAQYCQWFEQPLMITEFACANMGGDKAAWIASMFETMTKYSRIKMAIWWDGCDWDSEGNVARSYFLDETKETLDAFKNGLKKPWWIEFYA